MIPPRILAFAGSTHEGSWNKKLIRIAVECAERAGAEATLIDLRDFPLPLYDADLEQEKGLPEKAKELRELFKRHAGLIIASPEYNSSITATLKNTIDWVSRDESGNGSLDCFEGKVAALLSASPGRLGGLRGLVHLRAILGNIGVLVIPQQLAIPTAHQAFDDAGQLRDQKQQLALDNISAQLVKLTETWSAA